MEVSNLAAKIQDYVDGVNEEGQCDCSECFMIRAMNILHVACLTLLRSTKEYGVPCVVWYGNSNRRDHNQFVKGYVKDVIDNGPDAGYVVILEGLDGKQVVLQGGMILGVDPGAADIAKTEVQILVQGRDRI